MNDQNRELVLRAAALMRKRAEAAYDSHVAETWVAEGPNWQVLAEGTPIFDCSACAYGPNASVEGPHGVADTTQETAEHIASWGPGVARKVASFLEYFARFWPEQGIEERVFAVALARTFLREYA